MKESDILRLSLDWLQAKHIFSIRMNTGMLRNPAGRPVSFGIPGCADVLSFPHNGDFGVDKQPVWLEIKAPSGKQSSLQWSFQLQVQNEGHRYHIIRSLEDLEAAFR